MAGSCATQPDPWQPEHRQAGHWQRRGGRI